MNQLQFKERHSKHIYSDYIRRINQCARVLSENDRTELVMEFNSHIYEALNAKDELVSESDALLDIIEKLGAPEEILKPLIADKKLRQATTTFNPKHIFQALVLNFKNGTIYSLFGLLYLLLTCFLLLIVVKLIFPDQTGMFLLDGSFHSFGFISDSTNLKEVLGFWFFPLVLGISAALYALVTLLMRHKRKK